MPAITITKSYADGDILTEADLDAIRSDIITFLNTTRLDDANIQTSSITTALLEDEAVTTSKIDDLAVTTAKLAAGSVTAAKLASLALGVVGEVKMFYDFAGTLSIPRGWMIENGDQVTEAAYNAIHGAGAYAADGISASPLLNKHLPDMQNKFAKGITATAQNGSVAITASGNASHTINILHDHAHNHKWYEFDNDTVHESYSSTGTSRNLESTADVNDSGIVFSRGSTAGAIDPGIAGVIDADQYTSNDSTSALSATQSIEPHTIAHMFIIKVI